MLNQTDLSSRSQSVLEDIVDIYTETGDPVGSKVLAERSCLGLSSASYRNVMADLEKNGYLASPHTSAGRIPTEEGFRFYANSLVEIDDLDDELKTAIEGQLSAGKDISQMVQDVSHVLGEMTACTGLVMAPTMDRAKLDHVEFLRLGEDKVLTVMVTKDGQVENRVISVPEHISIEDLNDSAKHLRTVVEGQTMADARVAMMQSLMEHKSKVDSLMEDMMGAAQAYGEAPETDTALVVAGSQNLFQYPELVRDQLKELFQAFEEKRLLMALMNEVQKGEGVQIFIGKETPFEAAKDCAMITSSYGSADKNIIGTLGVVGPMRMNYKKAIQVVNYTSRLMSKVLENDETQEKAGE